MMNAVLTSLGIFVFGCMVGTLLNNLWVYIAEGDYDTEQIEIDLKLVEEVGEYAIYYADSEFGKCYYVCDDKKVCYEDACLANCRMYANFLNNQKG